MIIGWIKIKMTKKNAFTPSSVANKSVDWYTLKYIFDKLDIEFGVDPSHPKEKLSCIPYKEHY